MKKTVSKPVLFGDAATNPESHRAKIDREFRLCEEYWLRTIHPHIAGRKLQPAEWYIASRAYDSLNKARGMVENWNRKNAGNEISCEDLSGPRSEEFHPPELLCRDENLKPELLAQIASPLIKKTFAPAKAICEAHELLRAATQYIESLPEQPNMIEKLGWAARKVTFSEIKRTNETKGQLPFLPPVQKERNEGALTLRAIELAVEKFLKSQIPDVAKEAYERSEQQTDELAKTGMLFPVGEVNTLTDEEWRQGNEKALKDCLKNKRISVINLCLMRWDRFKRFFDNQQIRVEKRKSAASKKRKGKKETSTTATTAIAARRRKR